MGPEGLLSPVCTWLEETDLWRRPVHSLDPVLRLDSPDPVLLLDGSTSVEELVALLRLHDLDPRVVDLAPLNGKTELLKDLHRVLDLGPWFGFNWDALEEALHGPEERGAPERVLVCEGFQKFSEGAPTDAGILLDIVRTVARIPTSGLRGCVLIG